MAESSEASRRGFGQAGPQAPAGQGDHVRIGPISLFTLIAVICLSVLSVLAFSTANASLTMAQRQASSMEELYLDEAAAQAFVAGIDDVLAGLRDSGASASPASSGAEGASAGATASGQDSESKPRPKPKGSKAKDAPEASAEAGAALVAQALVDIRRDAQLASGNQVEIWASVSDNQVSAEFSCENGRTLNIVVSIRDDATYRIDKWKMTAVQNEEQPQGQLWTED